MRVLHVNGFIGRSVGMRGEEVRRGILLYSD